MAQYAPNTGLGGVCGELRGSSTFVPFFKELKLVLLVLVLLVLVLLGAHLGFPLLGRLVSSRMLTCWTELMDSARFRLMG